MAEFIYQECGVEGCGASSVSGPANGTLDWGDYLWRLLRHTHRVGSAPVGVVVEAGDIDEAARGVVGLRSAVMVPWW